MNYHTYVCKQIIKQAFYTLKRYSVKNAKIALKNASYISHRTVLRKCMKKSTGVNGTGTNSSMPVRLFTLTFAFAVLTFNLNILV